MTSASGPQDQASYIAEVDLALRAGDRDRLAAKLAALHPAEIADVLEAFPREQRLALWPLVDSAVRGEVLVQAHDEVRAQLIGQTDARELVAAVERLDLDELADLHGELPPAVIEAVLAAMDRQRRTRFETVRGYPEDTAGGLMDADAIAIRADVTLQVVLNYLRRLRRESGRLPEHTDRLMVVDRENRFLGALALSDLVSLERARSVADAMSAEDTGIPAMTPARRVARIFEDRDLLSAAVVDEDGKLLGRITVDDVVDVIRQEADRSVMGPAGLGEGADMFAPLLVSARQRSLWLGVNLANAFVAAWVIGRFDATIEQQVALAVLMPVVASMGGVGGQQSLALTIRGLALEQVAPANAWRLLVKELAVGTLNGLLWAAVAAGLALAWFGDPRLGGIFGLALVINLLNGAASGTLVPLALDRLGIDPALAGGVVLTALTDVAGFFCFLGLATVVLL
jgi:magnesium transporter